MGLYLNHNDIRSLFPIITIIAFYLLILLSIYIFRKQGSSDEYYISILGGILCLFFSVSLWDTFSSALGGLIINDNYSLIFYVLILIGFVFSINLSAVERQDKNYYLYAALLLIGVMIVSSAGSLVTVFAGCELVCFSSFLLIDNREKRRWAFVLSYFLVSMTGLCAVFLVYSVAGTADIYGLKEYIILNGVQSKKMLGGFILLSIFFVFKMSPLLISLVFNLGLNKINHTKMLLFNTSVKAAGLAALFRFVFIVMPWEEQVWQTPILISGLVAMAYGCALSLMAGKIRISVSCIGAVHTGTVMVAIANGYEEANSLMLYYISAYIFFNTGMLTTLSQIDNTKGLDGTCKGIYSNAVYALFCFFMICLAGVGFCIPVFNSLDGIILMLEGWKKIIFIVLIFVGAVSYARICAKVFKRKKEKIDKTMSGGIIQIPYVTGYICLIIIILSVAIFPSLKEYLLESLLYIY